MREYFGLLLLLLFLVCTFLWIRRYGRISQTAARVAVRLGGSVPAALDMFDLATVQFSIERHPASLEFRRGDLPGTQVRVSMLRRSPGVFRIFRASDAREGLKFIGSRDIKVGDPRFDAAWFVTSRPESLAHRIFTEERLGPVIDSVRRLKGFRRPSIEITRDTLVVRVADILRRDEDVLALTQTAIDFVGYVLRLGPEEGIAWVATEGGEAGLCPVCASALTEEVVQCEKCLTPQHQECWRYVGQCSTYACKGKRFVKAPVSGHERGAAAS